ncbi:MAG: site-specific integrase [Lentimicrobiaceae bacterium]|nr:site-specific integrase [Lentimicrobiaceae bacterium]
MLDNINIKTNKFILNANINEQSVELEQIFDFVFNNKKADKNIYYKDFVTDYINAHKNTYKDSVIKMWRCKLNVLLQYKPNLQLKDITSNFLDDYYNYLLNETNNGKYSANTHLKILRKFTNIAFKRGLIDKYAFDNFKIPTAHGTRTFLTSNEIKQIEQFRLTTNNKQIKNVCTYFLFSCFTGLRFSDIYNLHFSNIIDDLNIKYLNITMEKTQEKILIPLNKKALDLIDFTKTKDKVFDVLSNQKTNSYLKVVADFCNIDKNLTFHVARHTFATLGLTLGIPIAVISKLLGHANISTTQIYAKITNTLKVQEIAKFDTI